MKQLIITNLILLIILPTYITFIKYGEIQFGSFYAETTGVFTLVALLYSAVQLTILNEKKE